MLEIKDILNLQQSKVVDWHSELILNHEELPWKFIEENSSYNFLLWHEEDMARIVDIDPLRIVDAKRNIDRYNQQRNNAIEKIDEWILSYLSFNHIKADSTMHSETPGMMIDRLSIMALKRYHMDVETQREDASIEHIENCQRKVSVLNEQIEDLSNCLVRILRLLKNGELRFKVYRQFKMYNDPTLNPQLYSRRQKEIV